MSNLIKTKQNKKTLTSLKSTTMKLPGNCELKTATKRQKRFVVSVVGKPKLRFNSLVSTPGGREKKDDGRGSCWYPWSNTNWTLRLQRHKPPTAVLNDAWLSRAPSASAPLANPITWVTELSSATSGFAAYLVINKQNDYRVWLDTEFEIRNFVD